MATPAASNKKSTQAPIEAPQVAAAASSSGRQQQVASNIGNSGGGGKEAKQNDPSKKMMKSQIQLAKTQTKLVANLHSAASEGKSELVRLLLRCGADANAQDDEFGNTALHQAAWSGFSQTVQVLCKYRANTSIRNKAQFTPLHMACQQGHNQTVRLLLMANAKTEAKNSYGDTPLHTAARYGHAGAARILLSANCNPNLVNKNHDTPLHIAAAMGRRKLTKIFMQNGAEPAIKNKAQNTEDLWMVDDQEETAMDIALRKDLIDIQELIANPPPAKPSRGSRAADDHALQLGQLEQRYGALYAGAGAGRLPSGNNKATAANPKCAAGGHRKHSSHHHLANIQSSEDNCSSSRQTLNQQMLRLNLNHHHNLRHRHHHKQEVEAQQQQHSRGRPGELAVDVPGADKFASAHSLAANHQHRMRHHSRTKTISGAGAELRLLAGAVSAASQTKLYGAGPSPSRQHQLQTAASAADLNLGDACLPDAKPDKASRWADIMAKSGRFRTSGDNCSPTAESPVIEMELDDDDGGDVEGESKTGKLHHHRTKSASPGGGSLRSSVSKSRGRLLLVSRRHRKQQGSSSGGNNKLLVRRSNLGTCVGKLSLLRLRTMVNSRHNGRAEREDVDADDDDDDDEEASRDEKDLAENRNIVGDNDDDAAGKAKFDRADNQSLMVQAGELQDSAAGEKEKKKLPLVRCGGRRLERLERLCNDDESSKLMRAPASARAPNGNKLQATRPLAPLNDDTQLYAIPKKKQLKQQQQAAPGNNSGAKTLNEIPRNEVANLNSNGQQDDATAATEAKDHQGPDRVPSGGPALTSDGCQSPSSDGCHSSSSFARASPPSSSSAIASSSDECIESMDLVRVNKQQRNSSAEFGVQTTRRDQQRPAVVGVHTMTSQTDDLDLYAPGYSTIRETSDQQQQQQQKLPERASGQAREASEPYQCGASRDDHDESLQSHSSEPQDQTRTMIKPTAQSASTKQQQQPATKPSSRLRQLLHLEPRTKTTNGASVLGSSQAEINTNTKTAIGNISNNKANGGRQATVAANTGHYAYSPVVQSSSELMVKEGDKNRPSDNRAEDTTSQASGGPKPKSWLMSRFSLSSNNLASNQQVVVKTSDNCRVESVGNKMSQDDASSPSKLACNEDGKDSREPQEPNGKLDTNSTVTIGTDGESDLIKPKSAISGQNLELIEAQKSLATAAAAKVKRNRLFKMSGCDGNQQLEIVANANAHHHIDENGALTVKTSEPPFWNGHHHHQKYLIGGQTGPNHRSGTNSVGMSDSSPSNNGAESDNSIQTTTGSVNTDNASGGQLSTTASESNQNSSPLGILSRILLNSKSAGAIRQVANNLHHQAPGRDSINSSGSTLRQGQSGGSLSSSSLSSPASNDRPTTPPGTDQPSFQTTKLDQLGSRSRCPIVLARSNELVVEEDRHNNHHQSTKEPAPTPRLPPKSALKPPGARQQQQHPAQMPTSGLGVPMAEPMNGLPRVASYTKISTIDPTIVGNGHMLDDFPIRQQSLCNYHAMNRNHQIQAQYSPYLPYALGRYSIHGHCEPLAPNGGGTKYAPPMYHPHHHLSHHDLRSLDTNNTTIDLTLPASAINYEYYLEAPIHHHHHQQTVAPFSGQTTATTSYPSRYHQSYSTNDNSIYPSGVGFGHDESIYIPYHLNGASSSSGGVRVRDAISNNRPGSTGPATAPTNDLIPPNTGASEQQPHLQVFNRPNQGPNTTNNHHHQHHDLHGHNLVDRSAMIQRRRQPPLPPLVQLQKRPKSSLDTFLLPGAGLSSAAAPLLPLPKPNGGRQQVMANDATNAQSAAASASAQHNRISFSSSLAKNDTTVVVGGRDTNQSSGVDYPLIKSNNPSYSYGPSPYSHHHHHRQQQQQHQANGGYTYSENSIYASDQSAAAVLQHSDLTVLPTTDTSAATSTQAADKPTPSCYRQSPSLSSSSSSSPSFSSSSSPAVSAAKAITEGGNVGCSELDNGTSSVQVNSSSSTSASPSPAAPFKANNQHHQQQDKNSWTPSSPFRSLVQVKHSSSLPKSNQSSLSKLDGTLSSASMATIQSISADDDSDGSGIDNNNDSNKSNLNRTIRMNHVRGGRIIVSTAAHQSQSNGGGQQISHSKTRDSIDNELSSGVDDGMMNDDDDELEELEDFDGSTML